MMKEWFTARELADETLPGLPATQQGLDLLIRREEWNAHPQFARRRAGRGGGFEYHYRILPMVAQVAFQRRHMSISANEDLDAGGIIGAENLSERARIERDARLAIVHAYRRYADGLKTCSQAARVQLFCDNYAADRFSVEPWIKEVVPHFSKRSLLRWRSLVRKGRLDALGRDPGEARKGKGLIETANDGAVKTTILAHLAHNPHVKAERVRTYVIAKFGDTLIAPDGTEKPVPPIRTFQHALKALRAQEQVVLTKLSNPDKYRSTMAPSGSGVYRHITAPNQLWQIDASPLDAFDVEGRPTAYALIDIATRRTVLYSSRTPRSDAVALLLRKAILKFGVPRAIKTDNGSDFVSKAIKQLFAALDIEPIVSRAYSPQEKGHVERVIGTWQHNFTEQLPGYAGHSVADRKQLEDRVTFAKRLGADTATLFGVRFTLAEIQERMDRWIDVFYEHNPHSGLDYRTPAEVAAASSAEIRKVPEHALDILLMPIAQGGGFRKVTKMGVRVNKAFYQTFDALPGDEVMVRMDPNDLGRVLLFDAHNGSFVEEAFNPELRGVDPAAFHAFVKERRAELLKERTAPVSAEVKAITSGPALIDTYLDVKQRKLIEKSDNVVRLPKREVPHTTPDIEAALAAAETEPSEAATGGAPVTTATPEKETAKATVVSFSPKHGAPGVRPNFRSDEDMAEWLIANPDKVTERDRKFMAERLTNWSFNQLLIGRGTDPDQLRAVIHPQKKEEASP